MTVTKATRTDAGPPDARAHVATDGGIIPGAKKRILETANRLFYEEGIRSVGIDRLIGESSVTKATFYKHYGSKDRLIAEYLNGRHRLETEQFDEFVKRAVEPEAVFQELVESVITEIERPGFRGCAFLNAAAEYSDPKHPVRVAVLAHRDWYTDAIMDLLHRLGHELPGDAADDFILARDGAMAGGYAGDSIAAAAALRRATDRVLLEADATV